VSESNEKSAEAQNQGNGEGEQQPESASAAADQGNGTGDDAAQPSTEQLLEQVMAERDRVKDQLMRVSADFDNFRKRARKDAEEAERKGREEAIKELLPVVDNLERAVTAAEGAHDAQAVAEGVKMVLKLFEDTAQRMGLERIQAIGQRFDPNIHDAVQQQETSEQAPGTIVAEVVPGYTLGGRLLRAAMVVVAKAPSAQQGDAQQGDAQQGGSGDP
jgi:molecular chaperone GrpE